MVMAALVVAACGSGSPARSYSQPTTITSDPSTSMPSPSPGSTLGSPADTANQDATAAYLGMWADFTAAARTSDWQSPQLARYAADEALSVLSRGLYADHYNGLVTKGEPRLHPLVSSVDPPGAPTTVVISDCGDSTHWLKYHAQTGALADHEPGGKRAITATVEKQPGAGWKVTGLAVKAVGTC